MKNQRISINKSDKEIIIESFVDSKKQLLLNSWLILWTLAGLGIVAQFFTTLADGLIIYLVVWMAFWAYFEFKVIYAYRWRRFGKEVIQVNNELLSINREIAGRGIPEKYEVDWIKNIRLNENKKTSFFVAMGQSYWSPGNEQITFDYKGREVFLAMELSESDSKMVLKALKDMIGNQST